MQVFTVVGTGGLDHMGRGSSWPSEAWFFVLYNPPTEMQDTVASSPESGAGVKGRENLHIRDYLVLRVDSSFQVSYLFFGHSRSSLC